MSLNKLVEDNKKLGQPRTLTASGVEGADCDSPSHFGQSDRICMRSEARNREKELRWSCNPSLVTGEGQRTRVEDVKGGIPLISSTRRRPKLLGGIGTSVEGSGNRVEDGGPRNPHTPAVVVLIGDRIECYRRSPFSRQVRRRPVISWGGC